MKEREKWKGEKDEEVNGQGGMRGAPAPHGAGKKRGLERMEGIRIKSELGKSECGDQWTRTKRQKEKRSCFRDCIRHTGGTDAQHPFSTVVIIKNFVTCREFDGLFRCNSDHLRNKATVETEESFVLDDFAEAVVTVPVHHLVHRRRQTLVLHTRLYEVDWVHGRRSDCWITTHKILCTNSPTYLLTYLLNIKAVTGDLKVGRKKFPEFSWLFPEP